ncbi:MAG: lipase family protein [Phototrophicaceae bacterium]
MSYSRILLLILFMLVAVSGATLADSDPAPGEILQSEYMTEHDIAAIRPIVDNFYPPEQVIAPQYAVDEYQIRLTSLNRDGEPIEILAQLYIPRTEDATEMPVYVMGAGSSGLVDACAPSREQPSVQNWGSYRAFLLSIATQGYITIMPDYAGFNDPDSIQPYYVAEMAGKVMLDAGRAVYDLYDSGDDWQAESTGVTPDELVFMAGYSQGGQSIFAAKDMWQDYAPELPLAGVIGYAPVVNMQYHMLRLPQLAPYRMYAWADYYGADLVNYEEVFADGWLATLEEDVLRLCVIDAAGYFSASPAELYRPEFLVSLQNETLDEDYPDLYELFEMNNPGFVQNDVPALIIQGTLDNTLPMWVHEAFVEPYCEIGNHLTEFIAEDVTHFTVRQVSYRFVMEWMQTIASGETPRNDCLDR